MPYKNLRSGTPCHSGNAFACHHHRRDLVLNSIASGRQRISLNYVTNTYIYVYDLLAATKFKISISDNKLK